ncbi:hypothetical protein D3C77_770020 [compost metagenome]
MMCSGRSVSFRLSKYAKLPERTFTTPKLARTSPLLSRSKSTNSRRVAASGVVS